MMDSFTLTPPIPVHPERSEAESKDALIRWTVSHSQRQT